MAYLAAGFVGWVLGASAMLVVFVLDQQREDRRWRQWQPTDSSTSAQKELRE